jgi:hypothetical protein
VNNFDTVLNKLLEIHCWKGYRKVGTKMKGGKPVNDCRPIKEDGEIKYYRLVLSVPTQFRYKLGMYLRTNSIPAVSPKAAIAKLAFSNANRKGLGKFTGIIAKYAMDNDPFVQVVPPPPPPTDPRANYRDPYADT